MLLYDNLIFIQKFSTSLRRRRSLNSERTESLFRKRYSTAAGEATALLFFVMFFLPFMIEFRGAGSHLASSISSLTWRLLFFNDGIIEFRLELTWLANLPYIFLKYLFLFQFYRFYKGSIPEKHVWVVGLLSELQWFLMLGLPKVFEVLLGLRVWTAISWYVPIPITLITSILLMKLAPRPGSEPMWIDKEEDEPSWLKSEEGIHSLRSRIELILTNLKTHPIRSVAIIGLFIVYLPIVYQVHLNAVAARVSASAGMYYWNFTGCSLFPIPIDYSWFFVEPWTALMQLSPMDTFIYRYFYPSQIARVMWSIMWLTFGVLYIISPLLKSKDKGKKRKK